MLRSIVVAVSLALLATSASAETRAAATEPSVAPAEPSIAPAAPATTTAKKPPKVEVPTAVAVLIAYQRLGHDLLALQDQRGVSECGDLMPRFRAIKLEVALATPTSRTAAAATLADLAARAERYRGIHVDQACLDNPLAAGCQ